MTYTRSTRAVVPIAAQVPMGSVEPVYYSQIFVKNSSRFVEFSDLQGSTFAFNDEGALTGYHALTFFLLAYSEHNRDISLPFFGKTIQTGSHLNSIAALLEGRADVATIDVNVLARFQREVSWTDERLSGLRAIDIPPLNNPRFGCPVSRDSLLGPHPAQPIVASRRLSADIVQRVQRSLLDLTSEVLEPLQISRYVPINDSHYISIVNMIKECEGKRIIV